MIRVGGSSSLVINISIYEAVYPHHRLMMSQENHMKNVSIKAICILTIHFKPKLKCDEKS